MRLTERVLNGTGGKVAGERDGGKASAFSARGRTSLSYRQKKKGLRPRTLPHFLALVHAPHHRAPPQLSLLACKQGFKTEKRHPRPVPLAAAALLFTAHLGKEDPSFLRLPWLAWWPS